MRNPFRSEAEAFRFVLITLAAIAVIVVASVLGGAWVGVPVLAVLTAVAGFYLMRVRTPREIPTAPPHVGGPGELQILVVVDGAAADEATVGAIEQASIGYQSRVLIVCPARVSPIDHWTSAVDGGRAEAQRYLDESMACLRKAGIEARAEIGDEDPLRAIEDALRTFGADTILVTSPKDTPGSPTARDIVAGARARFALPIARVAAAMRVTTAAR